MTHPIYRTALRSVLALTSCLAIGCAVSAETTAEDPSETATGDSAASEAEADSSTENVASAQEELTACYEVNHHGGNLWEQDLQVIMGCDCGPGYVRDFFNVWHNLDGSCNALGWASPDPHDCRVSVHIHNAAWWLWGDCNVQVEEKPAPCAHDECATGGLLVSACSGVATSVCGTDPFCCNNSWDSVCVNEVQSVANSLTCPASQGTCGHPLCTAGLKLTSGCDTPPASSSCVASICAVDPYCCSNSWDAICVGRVASTCGKNCN